MDAHQLSQLTTWVCQAGLAGLDETATLTGFCQRLSSLGLPLMRANVVIDTLHPVYEGRAFTWKRQQKQTALSEYGRTPERSDRWERSPFYRLEVTGESFLRRRVTAASADEFPIFSELVAEGITDYIAIASRIAGLCRSIDQPLLISSAFANAIGEPKSLLVSVGRYALRGVGKPEDLYTLEPEPNARE